MTRGAVGVTGEHLRKDPKKKKKDKRFILRCDGIQPDFRRKTNMEAELYPTASETFHEFPR